MHFLRAIAVGLRRERDANRVADAFLQEHGERGRRRDDRLAAHAGFGQTEMQRVIGSASKLAIDDDQILNVRNLARQHDPIAGQPERFGLRGALERRRDQRFAHHCIGALRCRALGVLVHQSREQGLVEAPPIDADANRLVVAQRLLDHHRELRVALAALSDVAGIDSIFGERLRAIGMIGEQLVAIEVKIADQRNGAIRAIERCANRRNRCGGLRCIDGDANELRAGLGERAHLRDRCGNVRGVGVGHRLHDDRSAGADRDVADTNSARRATSDRCAFHRHHLSENRAIFA